MKLKDGSILVEVLIAITICALIAYISYGMSSLNKTELEIMDKYEKGI